MYQSRLASPAVDNNREAVGHLKRCDPVMADIIARVGPCRLTAPTRPDVFRDLSRSIVFQQLNGAAAETIYRRFKALYPGSKFPSAEQILATPLPRLRSAGLSPQKAAYIRDLAAKVRGREIDLRAVREMDDEDVIEELTKVKGVGRWTAEMVLLFTLNRPDVLPVDDYGFRRAVMLAYSTRALPKAERLEKIARPWRPYRSVGTWYMWQSLSSKS